MRRETKRPGRRRRALLAVAGSTLVALLAAELVARAVYGVPLRERLPLLVVRANETRGYEMVPGLDHYTYEHLVHVNALGLRGPELGPKVEGELRVLCLGDSTTYGQGVADEDTIPVLLQHDLEAGAGAGSRRVTVVNGGVRGYGTVHELALLEELGPRIEPDLVLLLWLPNDIERPQVERIAANLERSGPIAFDTGVRMEGFEVWKWRAKQILRSSALLMQAYDAWKGRTLPRATEAQVDWGLGVLEHDLDRFGQLSRERGFDLGVAAIPFRDSLLGPSPNDRLTSELGVRARQRGIPFVDLGVEMREIVRETGELPVLPYDGHYTGAANAVMARRLATFVRESFADRF